MKKYMLIMKGEDGEAAYFTDDYQKAMQTKMDAECGMGEYTELYERVTDEEAGERYEFLLS